MKKKPLIYLLIILPILALGGIIVVSVLIGAYSQITGIPKPAIPSLNGFLITLPAILLWIPISLLLSNCMLFIVPQLRRRAEQYAAEANKPNFGETQKQLAKFALALASVCVPLIIAGFLL